MNDAILLALLLLNPPAGTALAPTPAPVQVRSKALCTTLRENVRIALAGLMENDAVIDTGRKAYRKMAEDRTAKSGAISSDRLYVENSVSALVHNLAQIDDLLSDPARFPVAGQSADALATIQMKDQLSAIASEQRKALNILNGVLETGDFDDAQKIGVHPDVKSSLTSIPGQVDTSGIADIDSSAALDHVADDIEALQGQAQTLESKAATTVLAVAAQCTTGQN
jgi:hypothetical protein